MAIDLTDRSFDGVFANASLFHVPSRDLPRVFRAFHAALKPRGVLFASNPRGDDSEGFRGERYGCWWSFETWTRIVTMEGFDLVDHYYRPKDMPREEQPWLATVFRKR